MSLSTEHRVSAITPCYNEAGFIGSMVEDLLEQDLPEGQLELIFLDGGSDDGTWEILERYENAHPSRIRLLKNEERTVPHAMNKGIREAEGDIIVRLDAHARYPRFYIRYLAEELLRTEADNVGAVWKTEVKGNSTQAKAVQKVLTHPLGVGNAHFRIGTEEVKEVDTVPFGCFRRSTLEELGGYHPALTRNQDIELNKRLIRNGGRILLLPSIECTYYARERFWDLAKNNFKNGYWNVLTLYITRERDAMSVRHFIPLAFLLALLAPLLLAFFFPPLAFVSLIVLFLYAVPIGWVSYRNADKGGSVFHMMAAFFTLHLAYGLGSLLGLFRIDRIFRSP